MEIPLDAKHLSDRSTVSIVPPIPTPAAAPLPHLLTKGNTTATMEEVMKRFDEESNNSSTPITTYVDPLPGSTGTHTSSNETSEVKQSLEADKTSKQHPRALSRHLRTHDNYQDLEQGDVEDMEILHYNTTRRSYLHSPSHTRVVPYDPDTRESKIISVTSRANHHQHPLKAHNQHPYHDRDLTHYDAPSTATITPTTTTVPNRRQRSDEDLSGRGSIPSASSVSGHSDHGGGQESTGRG